MQRLHLVELSDAKWCARSLRAVVTDYLQYGVMKWKMDVEMASLLGRVLRRVGADRVVDLCSGSGGPWCQMHELMEKDGLPVRVMLTDKYPNECALAFASNGSGGHFDFCHEPVDAANVPESLTGFRTIFSALHHFRPEQVRAILSDAAGRRQGIAVFEVTQRTAWSVLNLTATSLLVPFVIPFIKPFRWSRLLWTYLIPVATPLVFFDSVVSCLRSYSADELLKIAEGINAGDFRWEAGEIKPAHSPVPVTYLIGYPI